MRQILAGALLGAATFAPVAGAQLTIRLTGTPVGTPPGAAIHVAGTFNVWNAAGDTLARQPDGSYAITLPASVRGDVAFKFTLGSWDNVETTASGADVPNHEASVPTPGSATWTGSVAAWKSGPLTPPLPRRSTASPSVRVLSDSFIMPQLGRTRRVWIYLPAGYTRTTRRYPVLYMHDGQNVFDAATSFAGEWGVDESLDSLRARGARGTIVVAVDNGGGTRMDEYDPWKSANASLGGGEGDAYVEFLIHTLKPYVDRHFRTQRGARSTGIMGSSMGALISLYAALKHPEVFGSAGVLSCACWVADPHIYAYARQAARSPHRARLYFVTGAFETKEGQPASDQRRMVDSLRAAGFREGTEVVSRIPADGRHAEWFWRREFPAALEWMLHARGDGRRGR